MQLSTKLKTLLYIFSQNKERELSYNKTTKNYVMEDKINNKYFSIIKEKYIWFDELKWIIMYNQIWDNFFKNICLYLLKVNLYKSPSIIFWWIDDLQNKEKFFTIFKIENNVDFINSILDLIDEEKEKLLVYNFEEQRKELIDIINKNKNKFKKIPLTFSINKYIKSYTQYYKTLKVLNEYYKIENIQIFDWNITFTISIIKNIFKIKFDNDDLYINSEKVFFKSKNTKIFQIIKLIFLYLKENNTNNVDFDNLEKYYKNNKENYKELSKIKFNYEYLRKSIETKTKEIEKKHNINNIFIGINKSWIQCRYYKPER